MAIADVLILGPIVFTNFSPPESMPFGGKHAMAIHKLIGGDRVIDTLGPDDADITWEGKFIGADAYPTALALDSLRASGQQLPLSYAGQGYAVVIGSFHADIRRLPSWIEYSISCIVVTNGAHGLLGAITHGVDSLVTSDLSGALALTV